MEVDHNESPNTVLTAFVITTISTSSGQTSLENEGQMSTHEKEGSEEAKLALGKDYSYTK